MTFPAAFPLIVHEDLPTTMLLTFGAWTRGCIGKFMLVKCLSKLVQLPYLGT